jgi:hypothetical protein
MPGAVRTIEAWQKGPVPANVARYDRTADRDLRVQIP